MEQEPILRLSDEVVGQIAAGEVVERPAAAVKELVENSIDAGATQITVELKDGGITSLRVSDNGNGIPAAQIRTAFERHTTSKLRTADDLFAVRTLGFRGEALASIAAVGRVTCLTRTKSAEFGVKLTVEAGQVGTVTEAASPQGTTITVRDLFFSAPVRLKFLKKPAAEAALVSDYIMRLILSRPDIAFRFVSQGKTVYRSAGDGTLEAALYCVYGKDALRAMQRVHGVQAGVHVDGYVGVGELARGNRQQQSFFVNGRYFRDEALSRALDFGCEGTVMVGRFPVCALMLTLPYQQVDVNVHPNKLQVRFQNPEAVARAVEELTRDALSAVTMRERLAVQGGETPAAPEPLEVQMLPLHGDADRQAAESEAPPASPPVQIGGAQPGIDELLAASPTPRAQPMPTLNQTMPYSAQGEEILLSHNSGAIISEGGNWETDIQADTKSDIQADMKSDPKAGETIYALPRSGANGQSAGDPLPPRTQPDRAAAEAVAPETCLTVPQVQDSFLPEDGEVRIRYIGAVFHTYLLFEAGERLLMVDQHAAHERILYDRLMARYEGDAASQRLMAPQMVRLTARDVAQLSDMDEALTEAGFAVEAFDATSVAVYAVPVILGETAPLREMLLDVLDEAQSSRGRLTRERLRRRVAQMACKHAIKAGDTVREEDVRSLLVQMLLTGAQPTCPHGRPIVSEFTQRELEKRFKRIP